MVLYRVYSQDHRIRYFARPFSTAIFFQIACLLFTFLPPLFTSYFTSGFYYKELTYTEQPKVSFLRRYHVISSLFSSSDAPLNDYFSSIYSVSTLQTGIPRDVDGDGLIDQETVLINVTTTSAFTSNTIDLWLIFQYALNRYPLVSMETLGILSLSAPRALSNYAGVTIYGRLRLVQREPLLSYRNVSAIQGSLFDYGSNSFVPSFDSISMVYRSRNYSTAFDTDYIHWTPAFSGSTTNGLFTIKVVVNIGAQTFRYVPDFWKEFRWTWVQCITALLPFYYLINKVKEFFFSNRLVRTVAKKSA